MKWSETMIARALAYQVFHRKNLVVVPNCNWTGSECDLLVVTSDLRIVDVEVKISRADLKADAKKDKWWHYLSYDEKIAVGLRPQTDDWFGAKEPVQWPDKVWKHYYAMPAEIWKPELLASINPKSGILLLKEQRGGGSLVFVSVERPAKPNRNAQKICAASAVDIARLASLRMWDTYKELEDVRRATVEKSEA